MSQIFEHLKKVAIFSLNVDGALKVLKDLASVGMLDSRASYEDLSKRMGVSRDFLNSVIDMLLSRGILRRKGIREFEVTNKEQVLEAIGSLEKFFSDNVVVLDDYNERSSWRDWIAGKDYSSITRVSFFARSDMRLFRLRRLAVESIRGTLANYLIVPRSSLKDLVLAVKVTERKSGGDKTTYVNFWWIDPEALTFIDPWTSKGSCSAKASELFAYTFDVEEGDLVEVDLTTVFGSDKDGVGMLAGKVFRVKGDVGEHEEVCSILAEVGRVKGYEVSSEHKIVGDLKLDVAYVKDGAIVAAFEVVLMGNLNEALYKLNLVNAKAKFLVVGRDRIDKARKVLPQGVKVIEAEAVAEAKGSVAALAILLDEIGKALNSRSTEAH